MLQHFNTNVMNNSDGNNNEIEEKTEEITNAAGLELLKQDAIEYLCFSQ